MDGRAGDKMRMWSRRGLCGSQAGPERCQGGGQKRMDPGCLWDLHLQNLGMGRRWKRVRERESCQGYEGKEVSSDVEEKWHFRPPALAPCEPAGKGHCRALCSLFFCSVRVIIPDRSQGDIPHKNGCKALC